MDDPNDLVKPRIQMRRSTKNRLEAVAKVISLSRNELIDMICRGWLERHVVVEIDGEEIKLGDCPDMDIGRDGVRVVRIDPGEGGGGI